MTEYTKEDLDVAIKEAEDALSRAETIADALNISFSFSPAYGMGGHYQPAGGLTYKEALEEVQKPDLKEWELAALKSLISEYESAPETYKGYLFNLEYERLVDPDNVDDDYDSPFGWQSSSKYC